MNTLMTIKLAMIGHLNSFHSADFFDNIETSSNNLGNRIMAIAPVIFTLVFIICGIAYGTLGQRVGENVKSWMMRAFVGLGIASAASIIVSTMTGNIFTF